ncbi:MAG: tRNA (guanosine(37)-N1)-methyltransferase TrmD [Nitrospinae bacterium]|nr:tRNA (guanosine(37)-N1)-methyltransferase TrmD [Nitrospinota bacterium]
MRIDVLSIFPGLFDSFLGESLLAKALEKNILSIGVHDLRAYTDNKHKKVDDAPFGGGAGMVMGVQPIADAIDALKKDSPAKTILLSPRGAPFTQAKARELANEQRLILVCGRYEGVDERVVEHWVDEELSLGDFVLNGGEVAAMAVIEAVFRLLPGAVGCEGSLEHESFERGLLEYPQYTRPENFRGHTVPEELLSGHHANIEKWRYAEAVKKTQKMRPGLLEQFAAQRPRPRFSVALVHHPVANKEGGEMTSSITTLDVHDLARTGKTYGAQRAYIVTPVEDQALLTDRMKKHWREEDVAKRMDSRRAEAIELLKTVPSVEIAVADAKRRSKKVKLLATTASRFPGAVSPGQWRAMAVEGEEWIVMFGTAYGLGKSLVERADAVLTPIEGAGEFNHLPVRGASAIILDRLFGR